MDRLVSCLSTVDLIIGWRKFGTLFNIMPNQEKKAVYTLSTSQVPFES